MSSKLGIGAFIHSQPGRPKAVKSTGRQLLRHMLSWSQIKTGKLRASYPLLSQVLNSTLGLSIIVSKALQLPGILPENGDNDRRGQLPSLELGLCVFNPHGKPHIPAQQL